MRILDFWCPDNYSTHRHNRAAGLRLMFALALGLTFASFASGQVLEAKIVLPDTLGPLNGPYHMAWDDNPAHPRLYIGGEGDSGGVIVAEAITCKRLARIPTGPVKALCYVPLHNKLYAARTNSDSIVVVDCATNHVISTILISDEAPVLQYNRQNDRLYCGGNSISVIDCAADTVIHTIAVAATVFALDSTNNKLCTGSVGPLTVVDCAGDSIIATVTLSDTVEALCYNPTAGKVYAVSGDTLYALNTRCDSIVARLYFGGLVPMLTCNPERNCVYYWYGGDLGSIDCAADTVVLESYTNLVPYFLACNVDRNLVYFGSYCAVVAVDGTTGEILRWITTQSSSGCGWSPSLDRLFCPPVLREDPPSRLCLFSTVDGSGDTVDGFLPLTISASSITLDTVHNRLYFAYPSLKLGCIGAVDCSRNIVTWYKFAPGSEAVCYNPNNNRLYWGVYDYDTELSDIMVYDCATESVVKRIPVNGLVHAFRLHNVLNKLYAETYGGGLYTIDCKYDAIRSYVPWPDVYPMVQFLVPEDNRYWYLGPAYVMVVDCLSDTVVALVEDHLGSVDDACACPEDRKVYAGWSGRPAWVVDMDDPADVDTLHEWIPNVGMRFLNIPRAHKAYWVVNYSGHPPGNSRVFVIDTRTSALVDSFWTGRQMSGMCLDHTSRYVYGTAYEDNALLVMDTQADSVLTMFDLPSSTFGPPLLNRATNRVYPLESGNPIPVIMDSMLIGLEELVSTGRRPGVSPTLVSRSAPLLAATPAELYDASGRSAAVLLRGPNDISHLVPGVYFVREEPQAPSHKPQTVRKIVIAR